MIMVNSIKCHSRNFLSGISNSIKPDRPPTKDFGGDSHRIEVTGVINV